MSSKRVSELSEEDRQKRNAYMRGANRKSQANLSPDRKEELRLKHNETAREKQKTLTVEELAKASLYASTRLAKIRAKETPEEKKLRLTRTRHHTLKYRYGLTLEEFEKKVEEQKSICPICLCEKKLVVDHNHNTGKVRALLCYPCNTALGLFKENQGSLLRAAEYLEKSL